MELGCIGSVTSKIMPCISWLQAQKLSKLQGLWELRDHAAKLKSPRIFRFSQPVVPLSDEEAEQMIVDVYSVFLHFLECKIRM